MSQITDFLIEKANGLPLSPGVYIMRDESGRVIYVGKSRALKTVSPNISEAVKDTTEKRLSWSQRSEISTTF